MTDRNQPSRGSDEAYVAFVELAWRRHMGLAMLLTDDRVQAEELLQDSLVRVYERWCRLSHHDDLHAYLRRVLINRNTSLWRRSRRESLMPQVPDTAGLPPGDHTDVQLLAAALGALPPRQRAVVVLRHYEDLSEREVARLLGCTLGTVKSQHAKASTGPPKAAVARRWPPPLDPPGHVPGSVDGRVRAGAGWRGGEVAVEMRRQRRQRRQPGTTGTAPRPAAHRPETVLALPRRAEPVDCVRVGSLS